MEDKEKKFPELLRKKGFYVALYGAVAVMLTVAVVISYSNFNRGTEDNGSLALSSPGTENSWMIDSEPEQSSVAAAKPPIEGSIAANENKGTTNNSNTPNIAGNKTDSPTGASYDPLMPDMDDLVPVGNSFDQSYKTNEPPGEAVTTAEEAESKPEESTRSNDEPKVVVIDAFREGLTMDWPVLGEIVMDYSKNRSILDITLEHYRTNESISISAPKGTEVRAAAEGMVVSTGSDVKNGNYVVIEHGNGWTTTYSQLQENLLVKKDDVVAKGQVIGGVADPSRYSTMLGPHVDFRVNKDNVSKDPKTVLAKR